MPYANENVMSAGFKRDTATNTALIPAPGAGKKIAIDFITMNPSGGANTVTLTGNIAMGFSLNDNQPMQMSNDIHNWTGIFPMNDNQAFSLGLSAATQVEGYVLYRILNG